MLRPIRCIVCCVNESEDNLITTHHWNRLSIECFLFSILLLDDFIFVTKKRDSWNDSRIEAPKCLSFQVGMATKRNPDTRRRWSAELEVGQAVDGPEFCLMTMVAVLLAVLVWAVRVFECCGPAIGQLSRHLLWSIRCSAVRGVLFELQDWSRLQKLVSCRDVRIADLKRPIRFGFARLTQCCEEEWTFHCLEPLANSPGQKPRHDLCQPCCSAPDNWARSTGLVQEYERLRQWVQ